MKETGALVARLVARAIAPGLLLVATGCGGMSLPGEGSPGGSVTGGSGGVGGSGPIAGSGGREPTAGSSGSGVSGGWAGSPADGGASCTVDGKTYPNGTNGIKPPKGCGTCGCVDGQLACTLSECTPPPPPGWDDHIACGGLQGLSCPKGSYCSFPASAQCGAADQMGQCALVPTACPELYAPVCGCNDKTYGNACEAASAGVSVAHAGACGAAPGSCTSGGVTYPDGTGNIPASDGCNICSCNAGTLRCTLRACPAPKSCGARAGITCTANEYCAYTEGGYCGAADAQSVCKPRPMACDSVYAPVCGCDGKTYGNACSAAIAGSGVLHAGPCAGVGRSCVVGGVTYPDGSQAIPAADGCNTCGCTDGKLTCTLILCPTPGICGGFAGFTCKADEYCAFEQGQHCGAADASSKCAKRPDLCPAVFAPVCACDGKTYGNPCEAARAGFGVNTAGPCPI